MMNSSKKDASQKTIGIVGGGIMGIVAAIVLAKSGRFCVTIFEKEPFLGGLSSFYGWQNLIWDRFYHVILSTDTLLLELITEFDLQHDVFWKETQTAFYGEGKLVSFSSSVDFIMFPFMSLWQKCRLVLGILYSARIKDPSKLDKIYVRQWLTKVFGRRVYEQIWDPLLRSKLGDARERTSAAFIWATITRFYGARSSGGKRERMGHVHGGYYSILKAAEKKLAELEVALVTGTPILTVEACSGSSSPEEDNRSQWRVTTQGKSLTFDNVLFTVPCQEVLRILGHPNDRLYWQQLRQIEYLGVVCLFLVLSRKLSPYYVINLLDKDLPFTGIIEATNVVSTEAVGGNHLVYLPKYMPADDPMNDLQDEQIIECFVEQLKGVFPDLKDEEILHKQIFREKYVQPLQELNYLDRTTGFRTPLAGVYLANTSMIYNSTLNNNAVVALARKVADTILYDALNGS
jgi:protoporphyrinogen oxidase